MQKECLNLNNPNQPNYLGTMPGMTSPMDLGPQMSPSQMYGMPQMPMQPMNPMGQMPMMNPMQPMPGLMSPTVNVVMIEPEMMEHSMMLRGKKVTVVTVNGKIEGTLSGVYVDHLVLTAQGKTYHIRLAQIVYVEV
jgi:hypothetical protein